MKRCISVPRACTIVIEMANKLKSKAEREKETKDVKRGSRDLAHAFSGEQDLFCTVDRLLLLLLRNRRRRILPRSGKENLVGNESK